MRDRGFTLVEILLVVTIVGIIVTVVYSSLWAVTRTVDSVREKMELTHTGRGILWRLSNELSNAFLSEDASFVAEDETLGGIRRTRISFNSTIHDTVGGRAAESDVATGGIERIEYYLKTGVLYESVNGAHLPLFENVDSFWLRFFDGSEWDDEWDSSVEESKLPKMVEINLGLGEEGFTTAISIPLSKEKKL